MNLRTLPGSLQGSAPNAGISRRAIKITKRTHEGLLRMYQIEISTLRKFRASRRSRAEDSRKIGTSVVLLLLFFFWHW